MSVKCKTSNACISILLYGWNVHVSISMAFGNVKNLLGSLLMVQIAIAKTISLFSAFETYRTPLPRYNATFYNYLNIHTLNV